MSIYKRNHHFFPLLTHGNDNYAEKTSHALTDSLFLIYEIGLMLKANP